MIKSKKATKKAVTKKTTVAKKKSTTRNAFVIKASTHKPINDIAYTLLSAPNSSLKNVHMEPNLAELGGTVSALVRNIKAHPKKFSKLNKAASQVLCYTVTGDWFTVHFVKHATISLKQMADFNKYVSQKIKFSDKKYKWSGIMKTPAAGVPNSGCRFAIGPNTVRYGYPNVSPHGAGAIRPTRLTVKF